MGAFVLVVCAAVPSPASRPHCWLPSSADPAVPPFLAPGMMAQSNPLEPRPSVP